MNWDYPPPPPGLSERSAQLWSQLGPQRAVTVARQLLLAECLRALDAADAAREALVAAGGLTTATATGMTHCNPLVRAENDARRLFARLSHRLGLEE
jgi:phage terminase small subunit